MKPGKFGRESVPQGYRRCTMPGDSGGHSEEGLYNYMIPIEQGNPKVVYLIDVTEEDLEKIRESKRILLQIMGPVQFMIDPWVEP